MIDMQESGIAYLLFETIDLRCKFGHLRSTRVKLIVDGLATRLDDGIVFNGELCDCVFERIEVTDLKETRFVVFLQPLRETIFA